MPLAHSFPVLLFVGMNVWFFRRLNPRLKIQRLIRNTILAPFAPVSFTDALVGDVLTSVVRVLVDLAFAALYSLRWVATFLSKSNRSELLAQDPISHTAFFSSLLLPFLTFSPLWWRLHQNFRKAWEEATRFPYYANALKYALSLIVSSFVTFNPMLKTSGWWRLSFVLSTLYQVYWDVSRDWSLLQWNDLTGRFVFRPRLLLFKSRRPYCLAMAVNCVLRFSWSLTIVPEGIGLFSHKDAQLHLSSFLAAAEIVRRGLWCVLRLEHEHLSLYRSSVPLSRSLSSREEEEEDEAEDERKGGVEGRVLDDLEMERLLTDEEKRRIEASPHPKHRAFQINGATIDPFALITAEKRRQILYECVSMTLALFFLISLGARSKE